jgi:hypothetical protein
VRRAFAEIGSKTVEFAAYRSFVHLQKLCDLTQRALIEKIRGQQKTVFWREGLKRFMDRDFKFLRDEG